MASNRESPVNWYLGTYAIRFIEVDDPQRDNEEKQFLVWENTVLVNATSFEMAFAKVEKIGKDSQEPYKGGEDGIDVQWFFEGVTDVIAIYEELEDGCEIMFSEYRKKLKNIRKSKISIDELENL